jgi:hypothetical protein
MAFVFGKPPALQWLCLMLLTAAKRSNYSSFCGGNRPTCFALRLNFCDDCYLANKKPPEASPGGLM